MGSVSRKLVAGLATVATAFVVLAGAGAAVNVALPSVASAQTVSCPDVATPTPFVTTTFYFSNSSCASASGPGLTNTVSFNDNTAIVTFNIAGETYTGQTVTGAGCTLNTTGPGIHYPYGANVTCHYVFNFASGNQFRVTIAYGADLGSDLYSAVSFGTPSDTTPPVITVPSNIVVTAASGASGATVTFTTPTANDAVDGARPVTQTAGLASGASFPIGVTTNSYSSTDVAGNTSTASFTVTVNAAAPFVTGLSPSSGLPAGGTSVTITGTDFTGVTGVSFGGTPAASFVVNSATEITAVTPPHATGPLDVVVTTGSGSSATAGAANDFTYLGVTGLSPTTLSNGAVASSYSATLSATGCVGPCTFAVTAGALPAGVTLSTGGVLSGTPTAGGTFNFTVTATDAGAGGATASQAYTLTISAPTVTSTSAPAAASRGFAYSQTLVGSGGTGPYTFALQSGSLPAGITLSSAGVLSGTPTVTGSFPITVRITDSSTGSGPYFGDVSLTLVVNAATLTVTPANLPGVMAGVAYNQQLASTGGSGAVTYAVTAGALPTGMTMTTAGRISGTSYQVGTATFTVTATDAFGNTGSVPLRIQVQDRPNPAQDPDVRALDTAQAEAARRLASVQIDNFSRRLEDLHNGGGNGPAMSNGLTLNAGVTDLGSQADQRTQLGGGRMFDQARIDPDRMELNSMLWSASADERNAAGSMGGGSALGYGLNAGSGKASMGGQPSMNAAPMQSDGAAASGVRFWTGGAITVGERDGDTGQAKFSVRSTGISMGVDFALAPNFDLGFGGGFGEESADIGSADSSVDSKQFAGVAYASFRPMGGVYVDGMLGYGSLEFDMQRRVVADGSLVLGEREGTATFGSIALGFEQAVSIGHMNAYGRIESLDATLDAYTETGSLLWALSYAERDVESLQGVIGARYVWSHEARDSTWTPSFRFEYRREFADGGIQNLQYADWLSGPTYQIQSSGWDRSELSVGFGLNVTTADGWKVMSELGARSATNQTAGTLRLTLSKAF